MSDITRAVSLLRSGELVAFPTETVYGLAADAGNPLAVVKVFTAKGRPADHPLIVHLPGAKWLDRWAVDIPDIAQKLAATFWPGPLTVILKRHPDVSDAVTGGQETIGLRVPRHPLALELLRAFAKGQKGPTTGGLAAPSANRFGRLSPTTALHVRAELGSRVSLILDGGPCRVGIESTIIDLTADTPRILRPGMITAKLISKKLGIAVQAPPREKSEDEVPQVPRVSGSLDAHYAPRTPLRLLRHEAILEACKVALGVGLRVAVVAFAEATVSHKRLLWRTAPTDPETYAQDLYATLHELDNSRCNMILMEAPPAEDAWLGVIDRLGRAAAGSGDEP